MTLVEMASAETDFPRGGPGVIDVDRERALRPVPKLVAAGLRRPDVTLLEHLTVAVEAQQGRSGDRLG